MCTKMSSTDIHNMATLNMTPTKTRKYLTIRICIGYYRVGYSSPLLYYELLHLRLIKHLFADTYYVHYYTFPQPPIPQFTQKY